MKLLNKLAQAGAGIVLLSTIGLNAGSAVAGVPGQIAGGNQNYTIANVTKGSGFANPQTADACDVLQYRLRLYNPGPSPLGDVKMEASINTMTPYTSANSTATVYTPDGQTKEVAFQAVVNISTAQTQAYQAGSTKLLDSAGNVIKSSANGTLADTITMGGGGIDLGSLTDSTTEYVEFNTKLSCPTPPPPATPVYSCDAFNIVADVNRTIKISAFSTTAKNGASFNNAVVTWGDTSSPLSSANIVGQSHQYAKDGTYTVTATAHFKINGQGDVTAGGPQCVKQVTFSSTTPPKVTPPPTTPPSTPPATPPAATPTALVNTGPGSVAGLFAAASAAGAVAYRWMLTRRLSRQ